MSVEEVNLARAKAALDCVRAAQGPELRGDYLNAVESFPFTARALGLGQALALLRAAGAKDDGQQHPGHGQFYRDLESWLCIKQRHSPYRGKGNNDLLLALTSGNQADYRAALVETEAYLTWLKPFAQALLSENPTPRSTPDAAGL